MKNLIKTFSKSKLALSLSAAILLSACGGTDQDEGTISTTEQIFGGLAIDGYLARSTVFLDTNNDGTRNAWEPFAFTDNQGYYSFNPITNTNYCSDSATAAQAQYCLRTNTNLTDVVVRIDGGYDIYTGEPFIGQLSRRLINIPDEGVDGTLVSPISSLLTSVNSETEQQVILSSLNLPIDSIDINYLNTDSNSAINSTLLNASVKIHKVVTVLADRLNDTYSDIGEEIGTPNDATSLVYPELANQLITSSMAFDAVINDRVLISHVLDNAESSLREVYQRKDFDLPIDLGTVDFPNNFERVMTVSSKVVDVVNSAINPNIILDQSEALGSLRAVESVVIKALNEINVDSTIDTAALFFMNSDRSLIDSLLGSLSLDTADVFSLTTNDFSGDDFDSVEDIIKASSLTEDVQPFTQIGGLTLRVSDLDLGYAPNKLDDNEVEFYFEGSAEDTDGSFAACVKYIDDASSNGSLGEGNTRGELVNGYWSLLGASSTNMESYSVLLTITFLGTTYQGIIKPSGEQTINDVNYQKVRFDNDGELNVFHSEEGFINSVSAPVSNAECQERLPSRIGL